MLHLQNRGIRRGIWGKIEEISEKERLLSQSI
jgi:hypothetical protein